MQIPVIAFLLDAMVRNDEAVGVLISGTLWG